MKKYRIVISNMGYISPCYESEIADYESNNLKEVVNKIKEFITSDMKEFEGEKIAFKNFKIKKQDFNVKNDYIVDIIIMEDTECRTSIVKQII
jgi:hypothetical protein